MELVAPGMAGPEHLREALALVALGNGKAASRKKEEGCIQTVPFNRVFQGAAYSLL